MFLDNAHSMAMIVHSMRVIKVAVEHVNPSQAPVIALDQPLFALAKQIQWKIPEFGEDKFVVMMGGLHIKMASFKMLGKLLSGSGWPEVMCNAGVATQGIAESFLSASHVTRTRRAHQGEDSALDVCHGSSQLFQVALSSLSGYVSPSVSCFEEMGNPFQDESENLMAIYTRDIMGDEVVKTIRNASKIGEEQFKSFVEGRFIDGSKPVTDTLKKNNLPTLNTLTKKAVSKDKAKVQNQPWPPSLSELGQLRGVKADLIKCLPNTTPQSPTQPEADIVILDGAVIVQMLQPRTARTFIEYATTVFAPYVLKHLEMARRVDLVWDVYQDDSLKKSLREKRGTGQRRKVLESTRIPHDWKSFLRVNENKEELFKLLATKVVSLAVPEVLAVSIVNTLAIDEMWITHGSGKNVHNIPVHAVAASLGPAKSTAMPLFHALTGCDTVSYFRGRGKKTAWDVWGIFPELTPVLSALKTSPEDITEESMAVLERFVVLLYDRTSSLAKVNEARQQLFSKRSRELDTSASKPIRLGMAAPRSTLVSILDNPSHKPRTLVTNSSVVDVKFHVSAGVAKNIRYEHIRHMTLPIII
ncbi:Hypothetical predicted protein, partial [Paramuricea clavata]